MDTQTTNEEVVSKAFDCIAIVRSELDKKGKVSFKEIAALTSKCDVDTNFIFGNMSFDKDVYIDYVKSEIRLV